jgi:thiamine pyrophosphokinase
MNPFVILLGGDLTVTSRLMRQVAGARVLAADSGMRHAVALGVEVEAWLGDFDSSDEDLLRACADIHRIAFPSDKAKTDGELAIDEALSRGANSLILVGALGGERSDHANLHLAQAMMLAETGTRCVLSSGHEEAVPLMPETRTFDYPAGTMFSIIGLQDLDGITIEGAKWPLKDQTIPFGSSLTMSNVVTDQLAVSLKQGRAILFANLPAH